MVIWIFIPHLFYLAVDIFFQGLDRLMPVVRYASVCVVFGFVIRANTDAMNSQIVLVEKPDETVDIISNLFDYPRILVFCLILLLLDVLVQLTILSDMTESARNVIPIPVTIYPVDILLRPDLVYFKCNRLREFFLRIILHAIGNSDLMAFNISEDV